MAPFFIRGFRREPEQPAVSIPHSLTLIEDDWSRDIFGTLVGEEVDFKSFMEAVDPADLIHSDRLEFDGFVPSVSMVCDS